MQKNLQERSKKGISLISLIITIIVIIILAAIVIFTGLGTPDSANFAKFTQQVDNVYMAVLNKHAELKTKHAIAGHYRTDEQIYIEIAVAHDPEQYATMGTTVVNNDNTGDSIGASTGIQNIDPNHSNESNNPSSLEMNLPKVRESNQGWYVTKEGRVFNANGYIYDGKTYFSGSLYQEGSLPAQNTMQEGNAGRIYAAIQNDVNVVTEATGLNGTARGTTPTEPAEPAESTTPSVSMYDETDTTMDIGDKVKITFGGETQEIFYYVGKSADGLRNVYLKDTLLEGTTSWTTGSSPWTSRANGSYPYDLNVDAKAHPTEYNNGDNPYQRAADYGTERGLTTGRLMTKTEYDNFSNTTTNPNWSASVWNPENRYKDWWLGSASDADWVYGVVCLSGGLRSGNPRGSDDGIRPVIEF